MDDFRTIYVLSNSTTDRNVLDFNNTIPHALYDHLIFEDYSYFNETHLPENYSIIILNISGVLIDTLLNFYGLIGGHNDLIFFLFGNEVEGELNQLKDLKHGASIFPPFYKEKTKYIIESSLNNFLAEIHYEEKLGQFIAEHSENKNKLRELNSIFDIYRLVDREKDINSLFEKSIPIIAKAFDHKMSIRISFMGKEYETENFKSSSREFSDTLIEQEGFYGNLVMYVHDEDLDEFPITIEELNTFSTIRSLLSKALEGIIFEEMNKVNFEYSMTIISLFRSFTNNMHTDKKDIFAETISRIDGFFMPEYSSIITYPGGEMKSSKFYSNKTVSTENKKEILMLLDSVYGGILTNVEKKIRFLDKGNRRYTIIPFFERNRIMGFFILCHHEENKLTNFFNNSLFNMISEYLSLAITSLENLNNIMSYKQAIEHSPSSIVITDLEGRIKYVNPHFEKVTGYRLSEVKGLNPSILKSGLQDEAFYRDMWVQITSGQSWHGTFQNKCKDGSIIWESSSISPIFNNSGNMFAYIAIKEDITDSVIAQEKMEKMNEKLINTQTTLIKEEKLASIGRLAAGVAHELNNPIGFINSNFRSIKRYLSKVKELFEHSDFSLSEELRQLYQVDYIFEDLFEILDESDDGFNRIITIVNSLRSFSRIDESKNALLINLNDLIKTTLIVARNEIKYNANVHLQYSEIPSVYCMVDEINQVLLNLIINASQAISEEKKDNLGNIYISTESDGQSVICRIKDDGPGISDGDKLKIFDPFYTTKPVGSGTGLGLSISYDIVVNKHHGSLSLEKSSYGGAEFVISLPIGEKVD